MNAHVAMYYAANLELICLQIRSIQSKSSPACRALNELAIATHRRMSNLELWDALQSRPKSRPKTQLETGSGLPNKIAA